MTTLDDMAPEEQVVHNVIPLKDKMPLLGFSDVHRKAKSSLTVTFVRCQSDASQTDVQLFYCRTAEDTTATQSVSERDHAGNVDFILLCSQVLGVVDIFRQNATKESRALAPKTQKSCLCFLKIVRNA